jgi:hypothetical protein
LIFKLFSKGDQLKIKLANLKFSEIGDGRLFLVFGGRLVLGGRDYTHWTDSIHNPEGWTITLSFVERVGFEHPFENYNLGSL